MATDLTWNEAANRWEGDTGASSALVVMTYAALPSPVTVETGTLAIVVADPIEGLNGIHAALGGDLGGMARYWRGSA